MKINLFKRIFIKDNMQYIKDYEPKVISNKLRVSHFIFCKEFFQLFIFGPIRLELI